MSVKIIHPIFGAAFLGVISLFASASGVAQPLHTADFILAQAGGTGGTLGNDDKSVSGSQGAPAIRKAPVISRPAPTAPSVRSVAAPPRPQPVMKAPVAPPPAVKTPTRRVREAGPSLETFDGMWTGASTGACIPRWSWSFSVTNGIMTGDSGSNITGRIRPDGATAGKMSVFGSSYDFIGQMRASRVAGTWVKLGDSGCSGTWSATK